MITTAVYPGSFNPLHVGHIDVIEKAKKVFDRVVVLQLQNPDKPAPPLIPVQTIMHLGPTVTVQKSTLWLRDWIRLYDDQDNACITAVIRGLRNGRDFEEACTYQWANENLGLEIPFVHFISDRDYLHMSSTFCRELTKANIPHYCGIIQEPFHGR